MEMVRTRSLLRTRFSTIALVVSSVLICAAPFSAFASTTDGTIDSTYRYAWSENAGWVDFGSVAGNIHITDTALTGSAYGENIGWITLNPQTYGGVTNNAEGTLSGYAWSENAGWIDFSKVTIGSDGVFAGNAYGENIGWITFGTGNNKVLTDWRWASTRVVVTPSHTSRRHAISNITPAPTTAPSGLSSSQIKTILDVLASFDVDTSVIAKVRASLEGTVTTISVTSTAVSVFKSNLTVGSLGSEVKALQEFLNSHGYIIAISGVGSPGNETAEFGNLTKAALIKYQKANGITPSIGYFGPKTRNFINNLTL